MCPDPHQFAHHPVGAVDQVEGRKPLTFCRPSTARAAELSSTMNAMHVLSAPEMQACDRATTERFGIPSIQLMRAASSAVAALAREQFPHARRVTVLCGKGNNGGDGMMAARLLADAGLEVTTLLLGAPEQLTSDAAIAWSELNSSKRGQVHVIANARTLADHNDALNTDLIVDAVLGTGFKPPLKGLALEALKWLRGGRAPVLAPILAIDLPSGWPADETGATFAGPVFPADAVITFTAPKPAHVFGQLTRRWNQPVVVAPIGSPDAAIVSALNLDWAGSSLALAQAPRAAAANKGSFGHVLVVGGTFGIAGGKAGAPAMTAFAAMRAGAGLVTAAVPAPALPVVASFAPELMTWPLASTRSGQIAAKNLEPRQVGALTAGKTVLAIGPGLGQGAETAKFIIGLLGATENPTVIDADALNHSCRETGAAQEAGQRAHAGADAASRRDGAAGGNRRGRGSGQQARDGAQLCSAHGRNAGAQRRADAHRASRWPRSCKHFRQSGHGQRRQWRRAHRTDCGPAGAISLTIRRKP